MVFQTSLPVKEISRVYCEAELLEQRYSVHIVTAPIDRLSGKGQIKNPILDPCETDILLLPSF
jgi:hypothetical protein